MIGGIYKITNKINNKCYIGFSHNIFKRINDHMSNCKNPKLKKSIEKYGVENFKFEILEILNSDYTLDHQEAYYISSYDSINNGYNIDKGNITTDYSNYYKKCEALKKLK